MRSAFAILVCVAATYSLYLTAMELLVVWYSGSADQITLRGWIDLGVSTFVNVAALAMAWHFARSRTRPATTAPNA
ncbi:MAG: hypothetical protein ACK501_01685 [Planctomycetota bacterium]|jgi:membrane protein implicated in regulation of membrane protease activity